MKHHSGKYVLKELHCVRFPFCDVIVREPVSWTSSSTVTPVASAFTCATTPVDVHFYHRPEVMVKRTFHLQRKIALCRKSSWVKFIIFCLNMLIEN